MNIREIKNIASRSAIVIKGDPEDIEENDNADAFYNDIRDFLQELNFSVSFDAGLEHTSPKTADLWIGHSRGADRLRFASPGICLIGLNTPQAAEGDDFPIINNVRDPLSHMKYVNGKLEDTESEKLNDRWHYLFTNVMKKRLKEILIQRELL